MSGNISRWLVSTVGETTAASLRTNALVSTGRILLNEELPGRARLWGEGRLGRADRATEGNGSKVGEVCKAGGGSELHGLSF